MSFRALLTACSDTQALRREFSQAVRVDAFYFGSEHIFVKKGLTVSYLLYRDISRYFRRILAVPLKISCCGGVMELQNIVFMNGDRELVTVQLKDPRMLTYVLEELRLRLPDAAFGKPLSEPQVADG